MAKTSTVSLVNELNRMYQQSSTHADGAVTGNEFLFWMTRKYDVAWMLAKLTDDTEWWHQFESDLDALKGILQKNIA